MTSTITVTDIARACHEANTALQKALGQPHSKPWDDAEEWERDAATEGVQAALSGQDGEALWQSWAEKKYADGWTYGPVKDPEAKTHPCLVNSYPELPLGEQVKDTLFAAVVNAMRPLL